MENPAAVGRVRVDANRMLDAVRAVLRPRLDGSSDVLGEHAALGPVLRSRQGRKARDQHPNDGQQADGEHEDRHQYLDQ